MMFAAVANLSACLKAPGLGPELTDGCYYAGSTPFIRIVGSKGTVLVPGEVSVVKVAVSKTKDVSEAVFSPGFMTQNPTDLRTIRVTEFKEAYYMMDPFSTALRLRRQAE